MPTPRNARTALAAGVAFAAMLTAGHSLAADRAAGVPDFSMATADGLIAADGNSAVLRDNTSTIHHFWSGTVSLDYTEVQDTGGRERFQGSSTINTTSDAFGPTSSSPPDPDVDGGYLWHLYGPVSGSFTSTTSCSQSGVVADPTFEQPPDPLPPGGYSFDQFFHIYGPRNAKAGDEYVVDDMVVDLQGQENCGEGSEPWTRENAPFPARRHLQFFDADISLRLPVAGSGATDGTRTWTGTKTYTDTTGFSTVKAIWTYDLTYKEDSAACILAAKDPQKAKQALIVKVLGKSAGCDAKLKAAKLKIGKKVYVFIRKHPSRAVGSGETWKVEIPIKGNVFDAVKKALKNGKKVKAKAEFALDDKTDDIVVKIR